MLGMTSKAKIAAAPLVDAARAAVARGRAPNFSAYVARALEEQIKLDDPDPDPDPDSLLDELLLESGRALTDSERDRIDHEACTIEALAVAAERPI